MFALLLIAQGFSLTGGYIQTLALSWLAAKLGGSAMALSLYLLACYLPVALLAYPFGRWLDRRPQKKWLLISEGLLAALAALLWLMAKEERISFSFLLLFGAAWGCVRAFQTPLYQSLPKKLAKNLSKGTALLTAITCGARGLGPILGGALFHRFGAGAPFLINFLSFLPSLFLLSFLKIPPPAAAAAPKIKAHLPLLAKIFAVGFFGVHYNITFIGLMKEREMGSAAFGLAMGLLGLGALLGFFLKARSKKALPLPLFPLLMGALNLLISFFSALPPLLLSILLYGILDFWFFSTALFLLTNHLKKEETTAVMGLYTLSSVGAIPLGALLWGALSRAVGLRAVFWIIGGSLLLLGFFLFIKEKGSSGSKA